MHVTQAANHGKASASDALLGKECVVEAQAVRELGGDGSVRIGRIVGIGVRERGVEEAVLVLELVAHRRLRPVARDVIALVVEAGAIDVSLIAEKAVSEIENRDIAAALGPSVFVQRCDGCTRRQLQRCCQWAEATKTRSALATRLFWRARSSASGGRSGWPLNFHSPCTPLRLLGMASTKTKSGMITKAGSQVYALQMSSSNRR